MSADGDIVRAALAYLRRDVKGNEHRDLALAALARLEAAEARLGVEEELHEAATEECREWQDAARTWQDNYNAAEKQRDALASGIRHVISDSPGTPESVKQFLTSLLAEQGL